jgi:hypothetical protein
VLQMIRTTGWLGAAAGFAMVAFATMPQQAEAALVSCPAQYTTNPTSLVENSTGTLTAVSSCQYVVPPDNSNVASIQNINAEGFFGFTNWETNGQDQLGGAGSTGQSGTWSILNPDFANYDYLIAFKDGADTNLVAFLFNELYTNGVWSTPFINGIFSGVNGAKDVSHLTIARRDPGTTIMEPATLALFGFGLLGLGAVRSRRRRA